MRLRKSKLLVFAAAIIGSLSCYAATHHPDAGVRTSTLTAQPAAHDFTKIGPVAKNLWPFTALNVYDEHLKTDVFYITSFNSSGVGQLIRLDYHTGRAKSWPLPAGIGSWGLIQAKDGRLFLGSYNEGELLCFDPRTETWIPLPQMSADFRKQEPIICTLVEAPDGDIYYGTYPGAHLVRYDPHKGTVEDLGRAADENYLRNLAVTPSGIILCGVGTRAPKIVAYDPKTGRFSDLPAAAQATSGVMMKPLVSADYIVQPSPNGVVVYDVNTLKLLRRFPLENASSFNLVDADHVFYVAGDQFRVLDLSSGTSTTLYDLAAKVLQNGWYLTPSGNLFGLRVQSYYYVDVKRHHATKRSIPVDGLGQEVLWLRSAPDGTIYGGPLLGQTFFQYSDATGELKSFDQVVDVAGEIYYGVPYRSRLYTISYIEATLAEYDPAKPWISGSARESNPRMVLHIPDDQYRPLGGIHSGPGGRLYIGTQPDYGLLGGALSAFDPATEKLEVHRNIFQDEEVGAVAADDRYVYAEADRGGGGGSRPTASGTHFFVWDPAVQKVIFDHVFDDGNPIAAITTVSGHAYFEEDGNIWDYDRSTKSLSMLLSLQGRKGVPLESLQAAKDGTLWLIAGKELARIVPPTRHVEFFPETAGHATSGLTIDADGTIYFGSHTDVWMYRPNNPSPPASFSQ